MNKSLSVFEHKKGFFISNESIVLIGITIILFFLLYFEVAHDFKFGNTTVYMTTIWVLYFLGFTISTFFLHEHEYGKFKGVLKLKKSSIFINDYEYSIESIDDIYINSYDIKGQFKSYPFQLSRKLSNGLKNEIILKLKNGDEVKCHFLQTKRDRIKYDKESLTHYYLEGKIKWLKLLDILEITDYNKIQELKKEINT